MQVSELNDVKVYNLSSGKSLPEWLSERKRRQLLKQDVDVRRRIELIQDFTMPTASTSIAVSKDKNYILAAGVYKPRIKCYDVSQLSLKFERCFDSDAVKFEILSDDFSKIVLLQCDRYVEFHAQYGRYYRLRIPRFGRDLSYHYPSCDLFLVGTGHEIFRLNLEQGKFLQPYETDSPELNVCEINKMYQLLAVGSNDGKIEFYDPRSQSKIGKLNIGNCGISQLENQPVSVTALSFRSGLEMGVGLNSGHVLLFDIRSNQPFLTKDHYNTLPIKRIVFHDKSDNVLSTDSKVVKIWERETGKNLTAIEPDAKINDLCMFPESGLMFLAAEAERMGIYYIPEMGQAPSWCSFLDNITEELEESDEILMYDDYKFVTKQELENFGLSNLIGTNMLRAYMHGYFMDMRLYHQVKSIVDPFAYERYRKEKIKSKIDEERSQRIKITKKLPKINRNLAEKILEEENPKKSKKKGELLNILEDERFGAMFKNPDFQIDEESEEYKLLHPVVSKHEKAKKKRQLARINEENGDENIALSDEESSDDDTREMWREFRELKAKERYESRKENQPKLFELKDGETYTSLSQINSKTEKTKSSVSFSELLRNTDDNDIIREKGTALGSKEVTFKLKKSDKELKREEEIREHRLERKKIRRSAGTLTSAKKRTPAFWRGKK